MGTSAALPGPSGEIWTSAWRAGRRWARSPEKPDEFGEECLRSLRAALKTNPDAFGLLRATTHGGIELVDALDGLRRAGLASLVDLETVEAEQRPARFVQAFTDRVAGDAARVGEFAVRRSVVDCAEALLTQPDIRRRVQTADSGPEPLISDETFCRIYTLFFGQVVAEFLGSLLMAKVALVASLPLGPFALLVGWVVRRVTAGILSPCEVQGEFGRQGESITEVARELVTQTAREAFGLGVEESVAVAT
ncbi:hypothetical protein ACI2K4_28385 [Micromonospora sp. NPDC050397]|uniref:hypothetical protein n=1 Tax=Micromonospora sp. NPDC050397 TaxID=3364279 RepID=UPI00384DBB11